MLVEKDGAERLYFVVETKSSLFKDDLRDMESDTIRCGTAHFKALAAAGAGEVREVPAQYVTARTVDDLMTVVDA